MRVMIDNSKCKKKVQNIKLLLKVGLAGTATHPRHCTEYVSRDLLYYRVPDTTVPKFSTAEKGFMVKIPATLPSFHGKLVSVNYELAVYIKHDAWNEWGRGKGVKLPVKVLTPPPPEAV